MSHAGLQNFMPEADDGARPPPRKPPREEPSASWFLHGADLQRVLDDPREAMSKLLAAIPADARAAIIAFYAFGLTGSVTLNFNGGKAQACETRSHHRLTAA